MPVISKRKLESYKRAEKVAQEVRQQIVKREHDEQRLASFVIHWMGVTGKVKYDEPTPLHKKK